MKNQEFHKSIEDFLRALNKMGINMEEVSKQSGISKHSLSDWRNGNSVPKRNNLKKLRDYSVHLIGTDFSYKEFQSPIIEFCEKVHLYLQEMTTDGETEKEIINLHENNPRAQEALEPFLEFGVFDAFIDPNMQYKHIDGKSKIGRELKNKYKQNFIDNINNLIEFIDETSRYESIDICQSPLFPDKLVRRQVEEFCRNVPREEHFDVTHKITSVGEQWLQHHLNVSKRQIDSWRKGVDFPSNENLQNLKELVGYHSNVAFYGYKFTNDDFLHMFLPSLKIEMENQEKEYVLHKNLINFTDMLFYYCSHDKQVEELMENVEVSIKIKSDNSIASSFFNEIHKLKVTRKHYYDPDSREILKDLKEYFNMSIESINKTLEQDFAVIDEIVTKENIKKLESYAEKHFDKDQKEALLNVIDRIDDNELYTIYTHIR
ncbi:helix-turn-helix domain-containing protein [Staphylococcus haemolyticus]|uniref:helix-turn-helix domain-containing protein n=1 Tax=Staphylococcus haemolyticus TaxID=1283 RepID=UPI001F46E6B3|nr:helix-turn-helix transcriptional regulator [Staphylococcus haemolyticus]MCE4988763.1 helix-turn-helix transcriptional regulator [Staphylococcus haemolyticus]MCE5037402.1 helix-turn-helix transcriptional regulator [Staphylococcus haemolyticus]